MKAGTTLLFGLLSQHPQIYMPPEKELHFFSVHGKNPSKVPLEGARRRIGEWQTYVSYFAATPSQIVGEASTSYLYTPWAAENIYQFFPNVKLICVLRQPAQRALSHYYWLVRLGLEHSATFEDALALETQRIEQGVDFGRYFTVGLYGQQLQRYYQLFPRENILVLLYEELVADPGEKLRSVYRFLEVDENFQAVWPGRRNPSGRPRLPWLDNVIRWGGQRWGDVLPKTWKRWAYKLRDANLVRPSIIASTFDSLMLHYQSDLQILSTLLQRDLTLWQQKSR